MSWPGHAALVEFADLRVPKRGGSRGWVTRLPWRKRVVCRVQAGRETDGTGYATLYFPMEALRLTDRRIDRHYLGDDDGLSWRRPLDDWLAGVPAGTRWLRRAAADRRRGDPGELVIRKGRGARRRHDGGRDGA